jgi:hypothetical protein
LKHVRSLVLAAVAAALVLSPSSAFANRYYHADPAGDVLSGPVSSSTNPSIPEPGRTNGDIVASSVVHKKRAVAMRMQYRELGWNDEINAHLFVVRTPSMKRYVTVYATDGLRGGKVVMTKPSGKKVSCHMARKVDYTANSVSVVVPRSCLGKPRWVRAGMASVFYTGPDNSATVYIDDANTNGTLGAGPALGPKVRR